jgi:N-acetylglucosamine kinase-like BadF-type ATPase
MKAENYIMGIDGGGTKTIALAAGTDGWVYGESQGDSINYNAIGMEKARVNMKLTDTNRSRA